MSRPRGADDCEALAEQRSALVDGALDDADRERVLAHLVRCPDCRAEVAELRRLRRLLGGRPDPEGTPGALADRLVAIAGSDARAPLWTRPFSTARPGSLPSARRSARARALASLVAAGLMGFGLIGIGLAAAPPLAASIGDPISGAQAEFRTTAAQSPLTGTAMAALASGPPPGGGASPPMPVLLGPTQVVTDARQLTPEAALAVLRRAAGSADQLDYQGTQLLTAGLGGRVVTAQVRVDSRSGQGREVAVYDRTGRQLLTSFRAPAATSRVIDESQLSLLAENYLLTGARGATVAGRPATMVEARDRSAIGLGTARPPVARWWVDDASGLLLRYDTYDSAGRTTLTTEFVRVEIGNSAFLEHLPVRLQVPLTTTSRTLGSAGVLADAGWTCPDELAGLSLVRLRTDEPSGPSVVHMAYTDGVSAVSVFEQRGALTGAPADTRWDAELGAYVRLGGTSVATWQSGETVYTVVTGGSAELLGAAVRALPHEPVPPRTTIGRVRAGWARILESVMG